ncbi:MAG: tol-pal system protein YbgF [Pseudomonadota bacterium]|nr:tol-pal system protein YbgF [Pseudomonadota bacterium]
MKLKSFLSIITICQFSGCGVYEAQVNDSIEVHNQGIENRVTSLENKIDALKQELNQLEMMIQSQARDKSEQKLKSNNSENAKESFESSFELLRKGDYVSAEIALREYIKDFPMGSYTDDAKYWLAESLFSQDKFSEALNIFNEIIIEYPGSEKMMESILKSGFSYQELGDLSSAEAIFMRVIREYPNSSASSLAEERLKKIRR